MSEHPSYYMLDLFAAGEAEKDVATHVAGCGQCQAYLATPPAVPRSIPRVSRTIRWPFYAAPLAAAAAVVLFFFTDQDVRTKGKPTARVLVTREGATDVWSGAAVHLGDQLSIEIAPGEHKKVRVVSGERVLYEGAAVAGVLPLSLRVDGENSAEIFDVCFDSDCVAFVLPR